MSNLILPRFRKFKKYSSARDEYKKNDDVIFMDANENPFEENTLNRYPDPQQKELRQAISEFRNIKIDQIICSNGSNELIDQVIRIFCEPQKDSILICPPTFGMYKVAANLNNVKITEIPLIENENNFSLNVKKICDSKSKILFLPNPSAPTGNLFYDKDLEYILQNFPGIIVIDEAYIDFSDSPSFIEKLSNFPNLIVIQTFSKFWGLAGARIGMCFANTEIIETIFKIKTPYNLNTYSNQQAIKAIKNFTQLENKKNIIIKERSKLYNFLKNQKYIKKIFKSDANFIFLKVENSENIHKFLIQEKLIIRKFQNNFMRISIGTTEQNEKLIIALTKFKNDQIK